MAGNRAVAQLARRKSGRGGPTYAELLEVWKASYSEFHFSDDENLQVSKRYLDCAKTCNLIAAKMGVKFNHHIDKALFRISDRDTDPNPQESKEAFDRGKKGLADRVVKRDDGEYMKVHRGMGDSPTVEEYPLLPGMLIYTAESIGWASKAKKNVEWQQRHMQMYAGGGKVFENVMGKSKRNGFNLRTMLEGDKNAKFVWNRGKGQKFQTTLSIWDPFFARRTQEKQDWIRAKAPPGARMTTPPVPQQGTEADDEG